MKNRKINIGSCGHSFFKIRTTVSYHGKTYYYCPYCKAHISKVKPVSIAYLLKGLEALRVEANNPFHELNTQLIKTFKRIEHGKS